MYIGNVYEGVVAGFYPSVEAKYCEMCGRLVTRPAGSKDVYCFSCHKNFNAIMELLPRIESEEVPEDYTPDVIAAPRRSCRVKKIAPRLKRARTAKEIKEAIWGIQ